MYTFLIVDDEKPAREELKYILKKNMENIILLEADCGEAALELLNEHEVDIIFLDINMPDMDGISLSKELGRIDCSAKIVFATAYDTYAIQAFEINALDYVLKPFENDRIKLTVRRVVESLESERIKSESLKSERLESERIKSERLESDKIPKTETTAKVSDRQFQKISLWKDDKIIPVDMNDIVYIYAEEGNTVIKTNTDVFSLKESLCSVEKRLPTEVFLKVHRSFIINPEYIKEIVPWFNNTYIVRMKRFEKEDIPVSRSYIKQFREVFQL